MKIRNRLYQKGRRPGGKEVVRFEVEVGGVYVGATVVHKSVWYSQPSETSGNTTSSTYVIV